jgi:hypothetical protein
MVSAVMSEKKFTHLSAKRLAIAVANRVRSGAMSRMRILPGDSLPTGCSRLSARLETYVVHDPFGMLSLRNNLCDNGNLNGLQLWFTTFCAIRLAARFDAIGIEVAEDSGKQFVALSRSPARSG